MPSRNQDYLGKASVSVLWCVFVIPATHAQYRITPHFAPRLAMASEEA
jgi:hypothetical protein